MPCFRYVRYTALPVNTGVARAFAPSFHVDLDTRVQERLPPTLSAAAYGIVRPAEPRTSPEDLAAANGGVA